jgi:hypothetical protein
MPTSTPTEPTVLREERGRRWARMHLAEMLSADHFVVTPPHVAGGEPVRFEVRRGQDNRLWCTCAEFEELVATDPAYACDHIYAVHYSHFGHLGSGPRGGADIDMRATCLADLVTTTQLTIIRGLARRAGVDPDVACKLWRRLDTGDLSKLGAMAFIKHLEDLQSEAGGEAAEA